MIRQKLMLDPFAMERLSLAIAAWFERTFFEEIKVSVLELLAARVLKKLQQRLHNRLALVYLQAGKPKPIKFGFSAEEIFALLSCLQVGEKDFVLTGLFGQLHQVSLNYSQILLS